MNNPLRIVFFGTPDFAVASLKTINRAGFDVAAVVTAPGRPSGRGLQIHQSAVYEWATLQQLPILQPEKLRSKIFLQQLKAINADLFVVVAFRMLPEVVWDMPPMGTINVHGSLLPKYRGAAPINHAIIQGESVTGVTTFQLKHEIDTGHILMQKEVHISPNDNAGSLYEKLKQEGANLLVETLNGLVYKSLRSMPQPHEGNWPHAPKLHKAMMRIDWARTTTEVHNLIRGLAPYPAAFTLLEGKSIKIFEALPENLNHNETPGTFLSDGKTFLKFATTDGWLYIQTLQPEGKRVMDIASFLRGYRFANASK